ncbi:MAG: RsiV family protein [Mycobacterium sp.]
MKLSALAGTALTVAALAWSVPAPGNIATATASVPDFCAEVGGNWDGANCVATVESERNATRTITMALPDGLIDNPTIHDYLRTLMNNWKTAAVHMAADSFAEEHFEVFNHGGTMTAAFHEVYSATYGTDAGTHPNAPVLNNAYRTFTFGGGRQLQLADLLRPGTDIGAISSLGAEYIQQALDQAPPAHQANTYPFMLDRWTPDKVYSGGYKAWALTPDELILYMPDYPVGHDVPIDYTIGRMQWYMDGGTVQAHIPLSALSSILRPEYGGAG